jgi:alkylation response protein AidB-like acyl-CoA dehydrogenase
MLWISYAYEMGTIVDHLVRLGRERAFDARQRDRVANAFIDAQAVQFLGNRGLAKAARGQVSPEHSILKLFSSEAMQRALLLGAEEIGIDALDLGLDDSAPFVWRSGNWLTQYLRSFSATIPGGTSEIQRNIIAERVLGLPR